MNDQHGNAADYKTTLKRIQTDLAIEAFRAVEPREGR